MSLTPTRRWRAVLLAVTALFVLSAYCVAVADLPFVRATGTLSSIGNKVQVDGLVGQSVCSAQATGSGTVAPEVSQDGTTWSAVNGFTSSGGVAATTFSVPGSFTAPVSSFAHFRVRMTATGPAVVIVTCGQGSVVVSFNSATPTPSPTPAPPVNLMGNTVPTGLNNFAASTIEVGTVFTVTKPGHVTAIRFYKDALETGTHVGNIWDPQTQTVLASVTFTGETASGWQQQALLTPLAISAGYTYIVSVGLNQYYVFTFVGLQNTLNNGSLYSIADIGNGRYGVPIGTFPNTGINTDNLFADLVFQES